MSGVGGDDGFDFRLLVSRGRVVAAMARQAASWVTNVKQGGRPMAVVAGNDLKELAVRAAAAAGASFSGVDILYGADGRPTVLEVNSMPAWSACRRSRASASRRSWPAISSQLLPKRGRERRRDRACGGDRRRVHGGLSRDELDAPKPGNVHVFASGHRMTASDFVRSAEAAAGPLSRSARGSAPAFSPPSKRRWPRSAPYHPHHPAVRAARRRGRGRLAGFARQPRAQVLDPSTVDAALAFRAIARAARRAQGGAPRRVRARDGHAQGGHGRGVAARSHRPPIRQRFRRRLRAGRAGVRHSPVALGRSGVGYARRLSRVPRRVPGQPHRPQAWREDGAGGLRHCARFSDPDAFGASTAALRDDLLRWDTRLKAQGINPGTSADLTVATVFAHRLTTLAVGTQQ